MRPCGLTTSGAHRARHGSLASDDTPLHYERHRPEQTTMYRVVQQDTASFIAHTETRTGCELPGLIKDEFDAFLECGILAHGFLRLHGGDCGHYKLLAFSRKRRGFCPSCGARRMSQTAAYLVDPTSSACASAAVGLVAADHAALVADRPARAGHTGAAGRAACGHAPPAGRRPVQGRQGQGGAVALIQRWGSAANLHPPALPGAGRRIPVRR